jgi:hypothetical protein
MYGAPIGRAAKVDPSGAAAMVGARGDELLAVAGVREDGYRSKLEARYAEQLDGDRFGGLVAKWSYEALKLRLADRTFYTPDFFVVTVERRIELHEVKATWEAAHQEDARVKLKVAAELFPEFRFFGITPAACAGGGWDREAF